jgi:hypothetical protein
MFMIALCPSFFSVKLNNFSFFQVLYVSLHRHEDGSFYPGTGAAHEVAIFEVFVMLESFTNRTK